MKKHRLRRVAATISSIAMVVMLPMSSMAASAAGDPSVTFITDKTSVRAGDMVKVSIFVDNVPADGWNSLEFSIGYNENKFIPMLIDNSEWAAGPAMNLMDQMTIVNLDVNPILGASISTKGQSKNGEYLYFQLKVRDNVEAGERLTLTANVKQFAQSVIRDGTSHTIDLLPPSTSSIVLTVR